MKEEVKKHAAQDAAVLTHYYIKHVSSHEICE